MDSTAWKVEQDEILKRMFPDPKYTRDDVVIELGKSWSAIKSRARRLKLHKWYAHGGEAYRGKTTQSGYLLIKLPQHHMAKASGYVFEHIVIWEDANKSFLPDGWVIHHLNDNKNDNRPDNLQAMPRGKHQSLHASRKRDVALHKKISLLEVENKILRAQLRKYGMALPLESLMNIESKVE